MVCGALSWKYVFGGIFITLIKIIIFMRVYFSLSWKTIALTKYPVSSSEISLSISSAWWLLPASSVSTTTHLSQHVGMRASTNIFGDYDYPSSLTLQQERLCYHLQPLQWLESLCWHLRHQRLWWLAFNTKLKGQHQLLWHRSLLHIPQPVWLKGLTENFDPNIYFCYYDYLNYYKFSHTCQPRGATGAY